MLSGGLLLLLLSACESRPPQKQPSAPPKERVSDQLRLLPVSFAALPGWESDHQGDALVALQKSCLQITKQPRNRTLHASGIGGQVKDWVELCQEAHQIESNDYKQARALFEKHFQPYLASNPANDQPASGLFTGYYEIGLKGSRHRDNRHRVALYKRPSDLVLVDLGKFRRDYKGQRLAGRVRGGQLQPYENRAAIEDGALEGKDLELVWVESAIDAFFLQIQGSGRVLFADGSQMRVGYDGHNGHNYVSIGKLLIERGEIAKADMSMQAIRAWLKSHPEKGSALMRENPSFIFFRELTGEGPIGAQGVALTPGRSLAVDKSFLPLGLPVWLYATDPLVPGKPIQQLLITQDTGGAIRGPIRGDVFWGFGDEAAERAGRMKERGSYFLFLPKASLQSCTACLADGSGM